MDKRLIFKIAFETVAFPEDSLASYSYITWAVLPIKPDASSVGHVADAASIGAKITELRGLLGLFVKVVNPGRGFLSGSRRSLRAIVVGRRGWRG